MTHSNHLFRYALPVLLVGFLLAACDAPAVAAESGYARRVISFFTIGGSSPKVEDRQVGWRLRQRGWQGFVQTYIRPQLDAGVRRIQIHNPFGLLPDEPMQFDQFIHARESGMSFLIDDFVEAWRPVVEGRYTDGEPVEVIAYLGKLRDDPDFQALMDDRDPAAWLARAFVSMSLPLQANMSIGFDASAPAAEQTPVHRLKQLVDTLGVRTYIEARPFRNTPHWFDSNVIITDAFWYRSDPQRHPIDSGPWAARNDQLNGEVIRIVIPAQARDPEHWLADVKRVLEEGHTASAPLYQLVGKGKRLRDLLHTDSHGAHTPAEP